jgi:hypothetical protein
MNVNGNDTISDCISIDALHHFVRQVLESLGVSAADSVTTANLLVTTDSWGGRLITEQNCSWGIADVCELVD